MLTDADKAPPLTKRDMIDLFWQSDAPENLAERGSFCRIFYRQFPPFHHVSPVTTDELFKIPPPPTIDFYLDGKSYGTEMWVAVMCRSEVIVRPFPLHHRERLPQMRPAGQKREAVPCLN